MKHKWTHFETVSLDGAALIKARHCKTCGCKHFKIFADVNYPPRNHGYRYDSAINGGEITSTIPHCFIEVDNANI